MRTFLPGIIVPVLAAGLMTAAPLFGQHGRHRPDHAPATESAAAADSAAAGSAADSAAGSAVGSAPPNAASAAESMGAASSASADSAAADFIRRVRAGTVRFRRLEDAIAAGYRLVGPDFPGMGEHWVNIQTTLAKRIEPTRPAVLSYLRVDGEAVLTGAAFAVPLRPGEAPPVLPFPVTWHRHGGSIADETLHLNPHAMKHALDGPQLAMIHAWVWTENPAGTFAQQNWTLPFHRLGLEAPADLTPAAGKAAHLASGGVAYYAGVIERAGRPTAAEMAVVREVLERILGDVEEVIDAWSVGFQSDAECVERLSLLWKEMWDAVIVRLSPEVGDRLTTLSG